MPDLIPSTMSRSSPPHWLQFEPSAVVEPFAPTQEVPSQRRREGNVIAGGDLKMYSVPIDTGGLEATLFKNRADLKLITSRVAMHLTNDQRNGIFLAIDQLLDVAEWEDESSQITDFVFRSFLRFVIFARLRRIPNLGVSPDGILLAGWHAGGKSVYAEFFPEDQCMALIKVQSVRGPESVAWRGHVARLREVISNNGALECIE